MLTLHAYYIHTLIMKVIILKFTHAHLKLNPKEILTIVLVEFVYFFPSKHEQVVFLQMLLSHWFWEWAECIVGRF